MGGHSRMVGYSRPFVKNDAVRGSQRASPRALRRDLAAKAEHPACEAPACLQAFCQEKLWSSAATGLVAAEDPLSGPDKLAIVDGVQRAIPSTSIGTSPRIRSPVLRSWQMRV